MRRYPPRRLLTIGAWAGAAVTWAMALLGEPTGSTPEVVDPGVMAGTSVLENAAPTTVGSMPTPPEGGLLILRFTPVPPPPPEVIVRTVIAPAPRQVVVTSQGS